MGRQRTVAVLVALGVSSLSIGGRAQSQAERAAARDLGAEGVEAFQAGNYAAASEKLGRAYEVVPAPSLGLWSARALAKQGKLIEASERYLEVTRLDASKGDAAVQKQAQQDAARERDELEARIPRLTIQLSGADAASAAVTLDGRPVARALIGVHQPINPGKHVVEAHVGERKAKAEINVVEGASATAPLDLGAGGAASAPAAGSSGTQKESAPVTFGAQGPAADAPSRGVPAGVWVGLGVGVVGLGLGGATALVASQKKGDFSGCEGTRCPSSEQSKVDGYNSMLTLSTIGFIAGGVGLATAGVFWIAAPRPKSTSASVGAYVGPASAGIQGAF